MTKNNPMTGCPTRLRKLMKRLGITNFLPLATVCNVSLATAYRWGTGQTRVQPTVYLYLETLANLGPAHDMYPVELRTTHGN